MRLLERTKAPRIFSSLGKRRKQPGLVYLEEMSPKELRRACSSVLCSHPALEMTVVSELCLALDWRLMEWAFGSKCSSSSSEEGLGLCVCGGAELGLMCAIHTAADFR